MGGSSRPTSNWDPEQLASLLQKASERNRDAAYDLAVAEMLNEKLSAFNARDVEAISEILDRVRMELSKEIDGIDKILYGGSVAKHTYVDGISDVDALVVLAKEKLNSANPSDVRHDFAQRLRSHFGRDAVSEGHFAVTLHVGGQEIQLVPAVRTEKHLFITNQTGTRWARINPEKFSNSLTAHNNFLNGKLVPTIKLVKGMIAQLPDKMRLSGYHVESLSLKAFDGYEGQQSTPAMVKHWFREASRLVASPLKDVSGQSRHVDEYLGNSGSLARDLVSRSLDRIYRQLSNADRSSNLAGWRGAFGE